MNAVLKFLRGHDACRGDVIARWYRARLMVFRCEHCGVEITIRAPEMELVP